jgi:hypothetical protein
MASYTGTFETGVDGNTVEIADAGSATPWDDRAFDANGTLTYSNVQKYQTLACQMVLSATPGGPFVAWDSSTLGSSLADLWGRVYMRHSGLPNTLHFWVRGFDTGARAWESYIDSSGFIHVRDNGGTDRGTGAVAISTGQWIRLEFHATNSTTAGFVEVKLFNSADSTTPSETITSTGSFSTLAKTDLMRFGEIAGGVNASRTVYMDNILVNDTGYPGPFGQILLPDADTAEGGWTTAPLFSKVNDSADGTIITATAA